MLVDNPTLADAAAAVGRALAHPVRLQILELLRDEGAYVMHLTTALDRRQANISQHLAVLREAGLVADERQGMTVVYRVRDRRVFALLDELRALAPLATAQGHGPHEDGEPRCRHAGRGHMHGHHGSACHCPRCRGGS